jgi:hypothetical protein
MRLIPVGAAVISLVIKQWSTSIVLIVVTLFNAGRAASGGQGRERDECAPADDEGDRAGIRSWPKE